MFVFCNGMPRSASTWSFNVTKALLQGCFPGDPIQAGPSEAPVRFLRSVNPQARHIVIKCHSLTPLARTLVRTGAARVVFTTRDLADAVASAMAAFGESFDQVVDVVMMPTLALLAFHRETGNAAIVHYEEVVSRPRCAIRRIGDYLAYGKVTAQMVEEIAARTSFERMREKVEEINAITEPGRLVDTGTNLYDPETMLFRRHMGDGCSGKGRAMLNTGQLSRIEALVRDYAL
jgi:hypothetical protein